MIRNIVLTQLYSLPYPTINNWVTMGHIVPGKRGKRGRSQGHHFTMSQAIGLAVIAAVFLGKQGCRPKWVSDEYACFSSMTEGEALDAAKRTARLHPLEREEIEHNLQSLIEWVRK
jgi:hypothetical protein